MCRYFTEDTVDPIAIVAGLIQTGLFSGKTATGFTTGSSFMSNATDVARCSFLADFFYIYFTKVMRGQKFELPA